VDAPAVAPDWSSRGLLSFLPEVVMSNSTLDAFVKADRQKTCPVCKLPPAIRKQIVERKEGVNLAMVSTWLKTLNFRCTERQLSGHFRQGHDRGK
jgi:hypothetical protein